VKELSLPGILKSLTYIGVAGVLTVWADGLLSPGSFAQADNEKPAGLRVGMVHAPPYAMKNQADGTWEGLSIDLWRAVASELGTRYDLQEYGTLGELIDALAKGRLDVVAGLAATQQREIILDLSHSYYRSGLAIAVSIQRQGWGSWFSFSRRVEIADILAFLGLLILLWVVSGAAVLLFERQRNREMFGAGPMKGLGNAVWWAAVTMTTVGYGDKTPKTLGGRIVAITWMLASVVLIVGFTATFSSSLTAERLSGKVRGLQDLPHVRVGSVSQSEALKWLVDRGIAPTSFSKSTEGLQAIVDGRIDAFVFDETVLRHTAKNEFPNLVHVLAETFDHYYVCMGMQHGSPLREPINRALLKIMETEQWQNSAKRYIGSDGWMTTGGLHTVL